MKSSRTSTTRRNNSRKRLPKLTKKAIAGDLQKAFEEHLRQTEQHLERLEEVFEQLGMPARGKKCEGMKHLIAEGEEIDHGGGRRRDAGCGDDRFSN